MSEQRHNTPSNCNRTHAGSVTNGYASLMQAVVMSAYSGLFAPVRIVVNGRVRVEEPLEFKTAAGFFRELDALAGLPRILGHRLGPRAIIAKRASAMRREIYATHRAKLDHDAMRRLGYRRIGEEWVKVFAPVKCERIASE